jgi:hypothetical protein
MMTRAIALISLSALALTACSGSAGGGTTDTQMRNVDIVAGTASDEMILLDQASGESTAIDPSTDTGPAAPRPVVADDDSDAPAGDTPTADSGSANAPSGDDAADSDRPATSNNGDVVIRPPAARDATPRAATPRPERQSADAPVTKR